MDDAVGLMSDSGVDFLFSHFTLEMVKAKYHVIRLPSGQVCPAGYSSRSTRSGVICTKKLSEEEVRQAVAAGVPAVGVPTAAAAADPVDALAGLMSGMGFGAAAPSTPSAPAAAAAPSAADPVDSLAGLLGGMGLGVIVEKEVTEGGRRRLQKKSRKQQSKKKAKKTRRH